MSAQLRLASVFSDHMVLCRGRNVRIFGEAQAGREIVVSIHDHTASCTAVKGKFEAVLPPMAPGGPYVLSVSDGERTLVFSDVLIGDVFFAGGQSNMEMALSASENGERYVKEADYPSIRYCNFPVQAVLDDETLQKERATAWRAVAPDTCGNMSAVAFHFAVKLQSAVSIPIGIIGCYLGGTSILAWLDEDTLSSVAGGKALLAAYGQRNRQKTDAQYDKEVGEFSISKSAWDRKAEAMKDKTPNVVWDDFIRELGPCPWPPPEGMQSPFRPCGLAETMVKRIAPYTITGFLYYQGESDHMHPHLYRALMTALIPFWRGLFLDAALPFLFVQLPMYINRKEIVEYSWVLIRQAQEQVFQNTWNTGLAVMIDGGCAEDIHPPDKMTVGERLCLQARKIVYHETLDCDSPRALDARPEKGVMIVRLSAPLRAEKTPRLFELAGEDQVFHAAEAVIEGMEIRVASAGVRRPLAVRYAWVNYGVVNVFGQNGLPLAPFSLR